MNFKLKFDAVYFCFLATVLWALLLVFSGGDDMADMHYRIKRLGSPEATVKTVTLSAKGDDEISRVEEMQTGYKPLLKGSAAQTTQFEHDLGSGEFSNHPSAGARGLLFTVVNMADQLSFVEIRVLMYRKTSTDFIQLSIRLSPQKFDEATYFIWLADIVDSDDDVHRIRIQDPGAVGNLRVTGHILWVGDVNIENAPANWF